MKRLIFRFAKKYVISNINGLLTKKQADIAKAKAQISIWTARVRVILEALEKALAYLEDNKIDDEEAQQIVDTVSNALNGVNT